MTGAGGVLDKKEQEIRHDMIEWSEYALTPSADGRLLGVHCVLMANHTDRSSSLFLVAISWQPTDCTFLVSFFTPTSCETNAPKTLQHRSAGQTSVPLNSEPN